MTCIPNCPICGGLGYHGKNVPTTHPDFGKWFECPNHSKVTWDESIGITQDEAMTLDWANCRRTTPFMAMKTAIHTVLERGYGMLYIHGKPGTGKTMTTKGGIIRANKMYHLKAHYTRQSEMMNIMRISSIGEGELSYTEQLNYYATVRVLAVDEIGRDRMTDFAVQTFSEILDKRYQLGIRQKGITIWISNNAPEEILQPYQVDRLRDGRNTVLLAEGESLRGTMKEQEVDNSEMWWNK